MEFEEKIVEFDKWCSKCKHYELSESEEPCFHCLENPVNSYSHRPVRFTPASAKKTHASMV